MAGLARIEILLLAYVEAPLPTFFAVVSPPKTAVFTLLAGSWSANTLPRLRLRIATL